MKEKEEEEEDEEEEDTPVILYHDTRRIGFLSPTVPDDRWRAAGR